MTVDREAWLAWRRTGITATDVAAILGLSLWTSPYSVWADKVGLTSSTEVTDAMEFGSRAEHMIVDWFTDRTGLKVEDQQEWCTNPKASWMLATVDGFVVDATGLVLGGLEMKTTSDGPDLWDTQIPDHVMCQIQWQMLVTGSPKTWVATLHLGFRVEFRVREVAADPEDQALIKRLAEAFWFDHCVAGYAPGVDGSPSTTEALKQVWPGDDNLDALEAVSFMVDACRLVNELKADIATKELLLAEAENVIREGMKDHTELVFGVTAKGRAVVLATWRPSTRTNVDVKALAEAWPELVDEFARQTVTRTLRVKTERGTK